MVRIGLLLACMVGAASAAAAQTSVRATWDRNPDAFTAGYRVHYGTAPGVHEWSFDAGNQTSASLPLSPGTYYFAVRGYTATYQPGPPSNEVRFVVTSTPPPPAPVDCIGAWGAWAPASGTAGQWGACTNGQQTRQASRTFTVSTPVANGGHACSATHGQVETRTETQACSTPPPTNVCTTNPLRVTVTRWPSNMFARPTYTANVPVNYRYTLGSWLSVASITFTDTRGCPPVVVRR